MNTCIVRRNGEDIPVDWTTVHRWASSGYLKPDDLVFRPDLQEWVHPDQLREAGWSQASAESVGRKEAPTSSGSFLIRQGGREYRAPDFDTLQRWVREGRILPDSVFLDESTNRWSCVSTLPGMMGAVPTKTPLTVVDVARNYRNLVVWVGIQILFSIWYALADSLALLVAPMLLATVVALVYYAHETAKALGSSSALLWAAAMLIPCVNLLTLAALSSRASEVCRANGIRVTFLGPEL